MLTFDPPIRLEEALCNYCSSSEGETLYRVHDRVYWVDSREFRIIRCSTCALVYLNPRPVADDLPRAYPTEYFWNGFDLKAVRSPLDAAWNLWAKQLVRRRIDFLREAGHEGPVLDVGCGRGLFIRELRCQMGLEVHGLDLQDENVRYLRQRHPELRVHQADFLRWDPSGRFGAITMWHLLEHLHDPRAALQKAWDLLEPGGLLLIGTQNYEALSRYLQGARWTLNDVPRHLYHFTERTLERHLDGAGFTTERIWHWTEFFPVLGSHLFSEHVLDELKRLRPLRAMLLNLVFSPLEAAAILARRGCVMTVAARKGVQWREGGTR